MSIKSEKLDIVLPSRIGDCILSFPSMLCLKQLQQKIPSKNYDITLYSTNKLTDIIDALGLFPVQQFSNKRKLATLFNRPHHAAFLEPSSRNIGYMAKKTYGIEVEGKNIKYSVNMQYLHVEKAANILPAEFYDKLNIDYKFSRSTVSYFGLLLELGYSEDEILSCFDFSLNSLNFVKEITDWLPNLENYVVFCMEAAYGRKIDNDRRYKEEMYFDISDRIYEKYGFKSAYIGIDTNTSLPDKPNYADFRKQIDFSQIAKLMQLSKGYIGNDTGPLHLANLVKSKSIGIYARERTMDTYHPVFNDINTMINGFPDMEMIDKFCETL